MEIENNQMMNGEDETYAIPTQRKDAPLDQAIVGSSQVRKQFLNLLEEDERDTINSQHGISDIDDNRDVSSEDEPESMSNVPVLSDQNEGYTEIAPAQYQERELLASEEQLPLIPLIPQNPMKMKMPVPSNSNSLRTKRKKNLPLPPHLNREQALFMS